MNDNPAAKLGQRGGEARAKSLSAARRREIAQKAAAARWAKQPRVKQLATQPADIEQDQLRMKHASITHDYWMERVETARTIMAAAIDEYDQCRARLREAEQECLKLVGEPCSETPDSQS